MVSDVYNFQDILHPHPHSFLPPASLLLFSIQTWVETGRPSPAPEEDQEGSSQWGGG